MSKLKIVSVMMVAGLVCAAGAQSPTDGHVAGTAYVNSYFHLSYRWPAMLKPVKGVSAAADHGMANSYQTLLFSAREDNQPYGVVMVAEKLNVAGPHSTGLKSSAEMIDRLAGSLRPGPVLANFNRSVKKSASGRSFDELSYTMNGKPAAVMATQVGQYLIVFKCNAGSAAEMAAMEKSAVALRVTK